MILNARIYKSVLIAHCAFSFWATVARAESIDQLIAAWPGYNSSCMAEGNETDCQRSSSIAKQLLSLGFTHGCDGDPAGERRWRNDCGNQNANNSGAMAEQYQATAKGEYESSVDVNVTIASIAITSISVQSLKDQVAVLKIVVNRGECDWYKGFWNANVNLPVTLKFGKKYWVDVSTMTCSVREVEVTTGDGVELFQFTD